MPTSRNRKRLYILGGTLYIFIAILAIAVALVPTLSRIAFKYWLEQQHLQGDIAHIGLALNTGTVTVIDAEIHDSSGALLKLGKLQVRIHLLDLFNHKLTLEQVELENIRLQIRQGKDTLAVAGIQLKQAETPPPAPTEEKVASGQPWTIQLNKLHIANLDTCLTTTKTRQPLSVCNHLEKLAWNGIISISTRDPLATIVKGGLSLSKLNLQDEKQNLSLLQFGSLSLENVSIHGFDRIQLGTLKLQHLKMLPNRDAKANKAPTIEINNLLLHSVSLHRLNDLDIATIRVDDIASYINLKADNSIASLRPVTEYRPVESIANQNHAAAKPASRPPVRIKIGKINITSTKSFVLEDAHTKPPSTQRLDHFSLALGSIDSSKPGQASPLSMQFKYGKYGKIKVKGKVEVFAARPTLDLKASIRGLNLNRVSPYVRDLLQHKVKSGQLNAQLVIKIKQGKLDSDAKLTLYEFYISKLSGKEADKYQESLGIPLSAALSLLRDKNDTIKLELPVTGDVDNPDFSLNDIITTVSAKAIKVAIVNYYATLGLVQLVTGAFDLVTALRFDPLKFPPGQTNLTTSSREALDKFATMLLNRPQVHLVVCGHATVADRLKLFPEKKPSTDTATTDSSSKAVALTGQQRQQLDKLALTRSGQVKQYLVEQKRVEADRLIECNPEYKPGDDRSPFVELHI